MTSTLQGKSIIVLKGPTRSGKTQSIKIFAEFLRRFKYTSWYRSKRWKEVFEVFVRNNKRIGVCSRGDARKFLEADINAFIQEWNCDVIVCGANPGNTGILAIFSDLEAEGWEVIHVEKAPEYYSRKSEEQKELNEATADIILKKVNQLTLFQLIS